MYFEFKMWFRISPSTFHRLTAELKASAFYPENCTGRKMISTQDTCIISLSYLGAKPTMFQVADKFDVSKSSIHASVMQALVFLQHTGRFSGRILKNRCGFSKDFLLLAREKDLTLS